MNDVWQPTTSVMDVMAQQLAVDRQQLAASELMARLLQLILDELIAQGKKK